MFVTALRHTPLQHRATVQHAQEAAMLLGSLSLMTLKKHSIWLQSPYNIKPKFLAYLKEATVFLGDCIHCLPEAPDRSENCADSSDDSVPGQMSV